jgi:hypothetical protein
VVLLAQLIFKQFNQSGNSLKVLVSRMMQINQVCRETCLPTFVKEKVHLLHESHRQLNTFNLKEKGGWEIPCRMS